ncbi:MAG: hypothetical protein PHQ05_13825 [Sterolibacterium sp.]|nr:hypothetical protein [Sterolibacterium sp.]
MATTPEKVTNILSLLDGVTSRPIDQLISNKDWGTINFEAARADLTLLFDLCNHLKLLPIQLIPDSIADAFIASITQAGTTIQKIRDFNIENGNPTGVRDQLVNQVKSHAEHLLTTTQGWIAFLAYQKGDIQKNIEELTNAIASANRLLDTSKNEIEAKQKEIASIVSAARDASASAGVGVFTADFESHATALEKDAAKWFRFTFTCAIGTLIVAFLSIFIPIDKDATNAQIFQYISSKLVVLLVLLTATIWCGRIYKALMHQITVNKHRANGLRTFQAFVKATGNEAIRDAVLIETTRAIFANSPSGYLDSADAASDTAGTKILEIIKGTASSTKAIG